MATFTPPVAQKVTPRFLSDSTRLQKALFKYMRPLDQCVNTYIMSDGTVATDLTVPIAGGNSSTSIPYPYDPASAPTVGPPEGASGGPYGPPVPYATVVDGTGQTPPLVTEYRLPVYLKYWFQGNGLPYHDISANLVAILTAAGYAAYIS